MIARQLFCKRCGAEMELQSPESSITKFCEPCHKGHRRLNKRLEKYGLTADDYEEILERQGGGCAICNAKACKSGRPLHVDHDHSHGMVRGLLCETCNLALGAAKDSPAMLRKMAKYLEDRVDGIGFGNVRYEDGKAAKLAK